MEMEKLNDIQEHITNRCVLTCAGIEDATLSKDAAKYRMMIRNYGEIMRDANKLTHKNKQVKTEEEFREICMEERWWDLLYDATQEEKRYVRL